MGRSHFMDWMEGWDQKLFENEFSARIWNHFEDIKITQGVVWCQVNLISDLEEEWLGYSEWFTEINNRLQGGIQWKVSKIKNWEVEITLRVLNGGSHW